MGFLRSHLSSIKWQGLKVREGDGVRLSRVRWSTSDDGVQRWIAERGSTRLGGERDEETKQNRGRKRNKKRGG